jgi:glycosyltransferase involved in cell wall biosynthesis
MRTMSCPIGLSPTPRVSVLMTIYNAAPYLGRSIDSLIAQSFSAWELIAVENGSRDDSAAILLRYRDPRIRVFQLESNIGRTPALRYAFSKAIGEYIAVLDADDVAQQERLQKQVSYLDSHPDTVLLGTWAEYIDGSDRIVGEWVPPTDPEALLTIMASQNPIVHSSAMYRSTVAAEVGGYPAERPYSQDYGLWLKLVSRGALAVLPERLSRFRIVPSSMTRSRKHQVDVARDLLLVMIEAGRRLSLGKEDRRRNREEVAIARVRYAAALARSRRVFRGAMEAWIALATDPISLFNNRITRSLFLK